MSAKGKTGFICLCLGAILLIGALGLYQSNRHEALEAEAASQEVMTQLIEAITSEPADPTQAPEEAVTEGPTDGPVTETPTEDLPPDETPTAPVEDLPPEEIPEQPVKIGKYRYLGFITIPELDLELPVMDEWDYDRLMIAPCRFFGSPTEGNMVIAGHNFLRHFGRLKNLSLGSEIIFTDTKRKSTYYRVEELEILQPTDIQLMTGSDYDLSLFTCTYGGQARFTVRCVREDRQ